MSTDFLNRLAQAAALCERALAARLDAAPGIPDRLRAAMRHAVLAGGKRLRPFLIIETARLFGVADDRPLHAGLALELLHCYSLAHDDLPSMDNDALRRGQPTVHVAYDEATAILAGDALLTMAFEWLAEDACDPDPAIRAALVLGLAQAAGAAGMVGGQMLDLAAEGRFSADGKPLRLAADDILALQAKKTGALFSFAVDAGALIGRAGMAERQALAIYAAALGRAFQIADDILDAEGDAETLGKATGKDADAGKATLVGLLGLEGAKAALAREVATAEEALAPFGDRASILIGTVRFIADRKA